MRDLGQLVDRSNAVYDARYSGALLSELMFVGDAIADDAVVSLAETAYDAEGGQLGRLRELASRGDPAAQAFFDAVNTTPDWLDPELLRRGQRVALAYVDFYGLSLMHSLFAGGLFSRATLVTNSTGRLGSHPARRIQETGAFIGSILEPRGLEPGSLGFQTAVRVRLLHGSIRAWLGRSPGFSEAYVGVPLDQTMLAMTLSLFDYLNLRSMTRMGVRLTEDELRGHHHLWRYIGHLLGIDERLLTTDLEGERALWGSLVLHQAFPELCGEAYVRSVVSTVAGMMGLSGRRKAFLRTLYFHLSGAAWFGVEPAEERDPRRPVLGDPLLPLLRGAGALAGVAHTVVPGVADWMVARGARQLSAASEMARSHGFGVSLEDDEEGALAFDTLAEGVRERFASVL